MWIVGAGGQPRQDSNKASSVGLMRPPRPRLVASIAKASPPGPSACPTEQASIIYPARRLHLMNPSQSRVYERQPGMLEIATERTERAGQRDRERERGGTPTAAGKCASKSPF